MGALASGRVVVDEESMRVLVSPGGPADAAGMRSGDRIVSVDGVRVEDWKDLKNRIGAHRSESVRIGIDRAGAPLTMSPTTTPDGRVLVAPPVEHVSVGVGGALVFGATEPARIAGILVRGFFNLVTGHEKAEVTGPVAIVKETNGSRGGGDLWRLFGVMAAYFLPFMLLFALVPVARITPRHRP
jgi:regulator of sigma E protease